MKGSPPAEMPIAGDSVDKIELVDKPINAIDQEGVAAGG
jgi:hypothetical protein